MSETTKINQFWQWVTTARKFTINLLFLFIVLVILATILGSIFSGSKLPDPEGKALVFNPQGPIVEEISASLDPLSFLLYGPPTTAENVRDVLFTLKAAKEDQRIGHIILRYENMPGTRQTVL